MKKILVVEDNNKNLYLISFILKKNDYEVIEARNAEEGMAQALKELPDMILMDIQLPDFDGLELTRRLRTTEGVEIPIIAITSYAMPGDRKKSLNAGCSGYIEKPINPETIMSEIEAYF